MRAEPHRANTQRPIIARVLMLLFAVTPASPIRAQVNAGDEMTAPRVLSLPALQLTSSASPPPEHIDVMVLVDRDGTATLIEAPAVAGEWGAMLEQLIARSRFEPARRGGAAVPARVRVRIVVTHRAQATEDTTEVRTNATDVSNTGGYAATARVEVQRADRLTLSAAQSRDAPGALGDSLRSIASLPGVLSTSSLLPFYSVRGAPPNGTLYTFDEIPLPTLFHAGFGPSVIHPRLLGDIDTFRGWSPAQYGRYTGGVVAADAVDDQATTEAELELRLLDLSGYAQTPLAGGTLTVAGRYGYPGLIMRALGSNLGLDYGDYQMRWSKRIDQRTRFSVLLMGSEDRIAENNSTTASTHLAMGFHLAEARIVHQLKRSELGAAFTPSWQHTNFREVVDVSQSRARQRVWWKWRATDALSVRVGGDFEAMFVRAPPPPAGTQLPGRLIQARQRSISGTYAAAAWQAHERLRVELGARADYWHVASEGMLAASPRLRADWTIADGWSLHASSSLSYQPTTLVLPAPGLKDLAIERALSRSVHAEVGARAANEALEAELHAFASAYEHLVFADPLFGDDRACPDFQCLGDFPSSDSNVYGIEAFLRRSARLRTHGWVSYTLSTATARSEHGIAYTPTTDVRHVLSVVGAHKLSSHVSIGARLQLRSGQLMMRAVNVDVGGGAEARFVVSRRLPIYAQLDAQIAYKWPTAWGSMRIALEVFNTLASSDPIDFSCESSDATTQRCTVQSWFPLVVPNLSVRAQL